MRVTPPRAGPGSLLGSREARCAQVLPPLAIPCRSAYPKSARHCHAGVMGTAALRLSAFVLLCAGRWPALGRSPRGFFRPWEFFLYPIFPARSLFLQKGAPVLPSLRGVSIKGGALRVLRTFYKPSPHILVMPVAPIFRATAREKRGEKEGTPKAFKKRDEGLELRNPVSFLGQ